MNQKIVPASSNMKEFESFLRSPYEIGVFLDMHIAQLKHINRMAKEKEKKMIYHVDLIHGIKNDEYATEYICQEFKPYGLISTKSSVIQKAKQKGVIAVQRIFLIDSHALEKSYKLITKTQPDFIEVLPGAMPKIIAEVKERVRTHILAGTPQGGVISPILANVYLHYVLDLWFEKRVRKQCKGQAYIVRYADDFVCCFQSKSEAEQFFESLKLRLKKFNLEIAEDKTKIIPFGRFAEKDTKQMGNSKPATFDFLGFTHYCGKSKQGNFRVKRKSSRKKVQGKLKESKEWVKINRNKDIHIIMDRFRRSLIGYYNYYCITDNTQSVNKFRDKIGYLLFKWLNRRSQRKSFTWDKFRLFLNKYPLPYARVKVNIYDLRKEIGYIL
jgi:glycerol-3-phosphate responsive antiterminator